MAARQWTPAQRKAQSEKIRQWQPWESSTGAKTLEGKAESFRNAYKGGFREQMKELRQLLREQELFIDF